MQIPCGVITDKLGTKVMVSCGSAICAIGVFIFGAATSTFLLQLGRFLIGFATASAFLCCGKIAAEYFSRAKYALLMGVAMGMGCLGGIFGSAPAAYMTEKFGWRCATYILASIGILIAVLSLIFMKGHSKNNSPQAEKPRILTGLKILAKKPKFWIVGVFAAMLYLPLSSLAELWIVPYTKLRFEISTELASTSSILLFIGYAAGSVISAWIAENFKSYKKTLLVSTLLCICTCILALFVDCLGFWGSMTMLLLSGTFAGSSTLAFSIAYNMVPQEYSGTSTGFTNAVTMSSGIVFQPLLGYLLDFFNNADNSTISVYSVDAYRKTFVVVIYAIVLAFILTLFVRDTKTIASK
jgi:MFS family permease